MISVRWQIKTRQSNGGKIENPHLNCTHIANAVMRPKVEAVCRSFGYEPPIICTPQELMEG